MNTHQIKLSKLIEKLQEIQKVEGDLDTCVHEIRPAPNKDKTKTKFDISIDTVFIISYL